MMELTKKEIASACEAIDFLLASMTDDGSYEKAIERGFGVEVELLKKLRNYGI